ncbi:MAG: hypothetical protein O6703_02960, partial [Gammaproteobacteria bacterium]|nr:hypothetical protein [Gammaproteobacteria bacterium]
CNRSDFQKLFSFHMFFSPRTVSNWIEFCVPVPAEDYLDQPCRASPNVQNIALYTSSIWLDRRSYCPVSSIWQQTIARGMNREIEF